MPASRLVLVVFLLFLGGCGRPTGDTKHEDHIQRLEREIAEERQASHQYLPKVTGQLDDPTTPVVDLVRQLPGVVDVEVLVTASRPTRRIIHIRDWHFVPRDLYALDLRQAVGRKLADDEVEARHRELLLEVELVQLGQERLLQCLVKDHGLRRLLAEGLTPEGVPNYKEMLGVFKKIDDDLNRLKKANDSLKKRSGVVNRQVEEMARDHRQRLLEYGAAGRLAMRGEIEVLPLDDAELLERAKPIKPDGAVEVDPEKLEARHDGQVKRALASGPCAVLVLGGAHDLSASVRRLGYGTTEYIRVTTKRFKEVMSERDERR